MEKVKINGTEYPIKSATYTSNHVVKLEFAGQIPVKFGDLVILTEGGEISSDLKGFETIWKREDTTIWLSDNKTVYPDDDQVDLGTVDGETVYQKVSALEAKQTETTEKLANTEEELTNTQLALTELAAMTASNKEV